LNDNGEFVITLHNPINRRKLIDRTLKHVGNFIKDEKTISFSITSHEDQNAVVHLNQFYEIYDNNGCMIEKKMINLNFALIPKNDIEKELINEGFEIKEVFGNFNKEKFNEVESTYIIIIATKGLRH
jgi:hypothetical protein